MMPGSQVHAQGGLKRRRWSREEDQKLIAHMKRHPEDGGWTNVPKLAGLNRCGKSCRLRWNNYLRPGIKKENFTQEEEKIIISLQSLIGNEWALIAGLLRGRTDIQVKNYWNSHLKKKLATKKDVPTATQTTLSQKSLVAANLLDSTRQPNLHFLTDPVLQGGNVTPNPQARLHGLISFNSTGPVQALPSILPPQGPNLHFLHDPVLQGGCVTPNPQAQLHGLTGFNLTDPAQTLPRFPPEFLPSFTYEAMEDPTVNENHPDQSCLLITNITNASDLGSVFGNVPNESSISPLMVSATSMTNHVENEITLPAEKISNSFSTSTNIEALSEFFWDIETMTFDAETLHSSMHPNTTLM